MKKVLKGGTVVSGEGCKKADVLVEDGKIGAVAPEITDEEAEVVDVSGKLLFPGFIDAHTHFDLHVSGTVTADNFETGTKAALSGGTTMIIDFATQYKGESLHKALEHWHEKADGNASCDYGFHLAISDWNAGISEELQQIVDEGVTSFKIYMTYDDMVLDDKSIYQVLKRLKEVGGIAGVLPFIHQRGVDGAHEHAQPGDDVFELLVTLFGRHGARQRAVGVREVAQQGAFGAGDVVSGDVSGEVGGGFHHVAHHGFRR